MNKLLILSSVSILCSLGCTRSVTNPSVTNEQLFPTVRGETLTKEEVILPDKFRGSPTVLLVGYEQKAQFDIDRWILGLLQADVPVKIVEVPTIAGMMPEMVQGFISSGMRKGIPEADWASVVTVFGDAHKIIQLLGNEKPMVAHVVLLDKSGRVRWTAASGYSASQILALKDLVRNLGERG